MESVEIAVLAGSVALIGAILWYFFGERESVAAGMTDTGVQQVRITVKGGYSPDVITVKRGIPVKLDFYRDETASCTDTVIFGDFGIARALPAFETTSVEFTPEEAGEFVFACGMNMVRGKLVVI